MAPNCDEKNCQSSSQKPTDGETHTPNVEFLASSIKPLPEVRRRVDDDLDCSCPEGWYNKYSRPKRRQAATTAWPRSRPGMAAKVLCGEQARERLARRKTKRCSVVRGHRLRNRKERLHVTEDTKVWRMRTREGEDKNARRLNPSPQERSTQSNSRHKILPRRGHGTICGEDRTDWANRNHVNTQNAPHPR